MIIVVEEIVKHKEDMLFKRLYLCSNTDILYLLENEYLDDFITYDNGIDANINDPFLLSYIYAN